MVSTSEIVTKLSDNLICQATTPANGSRATTPAMNSFLKEYDDDQEGSINDGTQPVPDWYSLGVEEKYMMSLILVQLLGRRSSANG
jgi:hypothetical protein